jgi:regulation of enolase protein 1 (concanavalin A-like superfamily)
MTWLNEPPFWAVEGADLVVRSGARTDFWQGTFYGFRRDNGHFLHSI